MNIEILKTTLKVTYDKNQKIPLEIKVTIKVKVLMKIRIRIGLKIKG